VLNDSNYATASGATKNGQIFNKMEVLGVFLLKSDRGFEGVWQDGRVLPGILDSGTWTLVAGGQLPVSGILN